MVQDVRNEPYLGGSEGDKPPKNNGFRLSVRSLPSLPCTFDILQRLLFYAVTNGFMLPSFECD